MEFDHYLTRFLDEARDSIVKLSGLLLSYEQFPTDRELPRVIFREAHTLKGMASTMGQEKLASLVHAFEHVLDGLRQERVMASASVLDLLMRGLGALERHVEALAAGQAPPDASALEGELTRLAWAGPQAGQTAPSAKAKPADAGLEAGERRVRIEISLDAFCMMPAVRAMMIVALLEPFGAVEGSEPDVESLEVNDFALVLRTRAEIEALEQVMAGTGEVEKVTITEIARAQHVPAIAPGGAGSALVRVNAERLEAIARLATDLELLSHDVRLHAAAQGADLGVLGEQLDALSAGLRREIDALRLVPVSEVFSRFYRMIRELSRELGKDVRFTVEGAELELDRRVAESVGECLVHMLRNALDHGIELPEARLAEGKPAQGTLALSASRESSHLCITIEDDGRGMDDERILAKALEKELLTPEQAAGLDRAGRLGLIFMPGFSTLETTTSVSGRGVGMDVVKEKIEALGGSIALETRMGKGSRVTLQLPLGERGPAPSPPMGALAG